MKVRWLLPAALSLSLLTPTASAQPQEAPVAPAAQIQPHKYPGHVQGLCQPYGNRFCTNPKFDSRFRSAWRSARRTPKDQRRPVPFPTVAALLSRNNHKGNYIIYVVQYRKRGSNDALKTWKYGITRVNPWQRRANVGRDICLATFAGSMECPVDWIAVTGWGPPVAKPKTRKGPYFYARFGEASLALKYRDKKGSCPPGMLACI